mgnify:CR=1 FL=1
MRLSARQRLLWVAMQPIRGLLIGVVVEKAESMPPFVIAVSGVTGRPCCRDRTLLLAH